MKNEKTSDTTKTQEIKVVRLLRNTIELIELINLADIPGLNMESKEIINTAFYKSIQDATHLTASELNQSWQVLDLIAQIAATSPTLTHVLMNGNNLDTDGYCALSLSKSRSITSIDISRCGISDGADFYAETFAKKMPQLSSLNMNYNGLTQYDKNSVKKHFDKRKLETKNLEVGAHLLLMNGDLPKDMIVETLGHCFTEVSLEI
jgi:hypothetical protein